MSSMYEKIKSAVDTIRKAIYGMEVRNTIANAIEAMNEKTEDLSYRQDCLGTTFEEIVLEGGHTDAEVIAARTSSNGTKYKTLGKRLDTIESLLNQIENNLELGVYDEISLEQEEPTSSKVKIWIPMQIDDKKEDGTPADPTPGTGELDPVKPGEGDVITIIGETKKAIFNVYYPSEGQKDSMGNTLVGYPDSLTCAAPSSIPFGSRILVKDTGTELDNKIFIVTDRKSELGIKDDDTYIFSLCMKNQTEADKFGTQYGNATIGKTATTTTKIATVTASVLTVRSGPSADYSVLGYVTNGYKFDVLEEYQNSKWIKVNYNGQNAYINSSYTEMTTVAKEEDVILGPSTDTTVNKNNPVFGIDISHHNGNINWTKVKESGVKFAIIRIGYGSRKTKDGILDTQFINNLNGAKAAGIDIGVYFFSYAYTIEGLKAEANWVINKLNEYTGGTFNYPIFFDQEYDSLKNVPNGSGSYTSYNPGKTTLTNYMKTFCEMIDAAGYYPGIYGNPDWFLNYVNFDEIKEYPIWLAHWNVNNPTWTKSEYGIWQYGYDAVNGISGQVDVNRCYVDYPSLIKALQKNGF